jgi:hypothetical protein
MEVGENGGTGTHINVVQNALKHDTDHCSTLERSMESREDDELPKRQNP